MRGPPSSKPRLLRSKQGLQRSSGREKRRRQQLLRSSGRGKLQQGRQRSSVRGKLRRPQQQLLKQQGGLLSRSRGRRKQQLLKRHDK
jgi:hypothetical protein